MELVYNSFDDVWVYVLVDVLEISGSLEMSPEFDTEEDAKHWYKLMYIHFFDEYWSNT